MHFNTMLSADKSRSVNFSSSGSLTKVSRFPRYHPYIRARMRVCVDCTQYIRERVASLSFHKACERAFTDGKLADGQGGRPSHRRCTMCTVGHKNSCGL